MYVAVSEEASFDMLSLTSPLPRFSPISKAEISSLHVSVSILVGFEEAQNYMDWEVMYSSLFILIVWSMVLSKSRDNQFL